MLAMYLLGIVVALLMAWLFKKTLLKGEPPLLIMELPPYKRPLLRVVVRHMWDRSKLFLRRAGTVILGINILLWFLATYPRSTARRRRASTPAAPSSRAQPADTAEALSAKSRLWPVLAGRTRRRAAAPQFRRPPGPRASSRSSPRWVLTGRSGIGIVASFAAREVFVSTMSTVYNVGHLRELGIGHEQPGRRPCASRSGPTARRSTRR